MTKYLVGKDYPWLCNKCQAMIDSLAEICSMLPDDQASDEECPCNLAYDRGLFCGGHECIVEKSRNNYDYVMFTYQEVSQSGSFSPPSGTDVHHAHSSDDVEAALEEWGYTHDKVGSRREDASLLVWNGELKDVTDFYPDFEVCYEMRPQLVWKEA